MNEYRYFKDSQFEELKTIIQEVVKVELVRFSSYYKKMIDQEDKAIYVGIETICKEFSVSRQTVFNWEKGKVIGLNIAPFVRKTGGRKQYNLAAIKLEIEQKNKL